MTDHINHPKHYQSDSGIEAVDVMESFFPNDMHLSQAFKYMARNEKKDTVESNIRKAIWWLLRKLSYITGKRHLPPVEYVNAKGVLGGGHDSKVRELYLMGKVCVHTRLWTDTADDSGGVVVWIHDESENQRHKADLRLSAEQATLLGRMLLSAVEDTK